MYAGRSLSYKQDIVKGTLPTGVRRFDEGRIPLAVSAFDVSRLTTRTLDEGCIAQALRATCTFPGLFSPVWHDRGVLIDGGVRDTTGTLSELRSRFGFCACFYRGVAASSTFFTSDRLSCVWD